MVYRILSVLCALTGHAGGCWVMNGAIGQRVIRRGGGNC